MPRIKRTITLAAITAATPVTATSGLMMGCGFRGRGRRRGARWIDGALLVAGAVIALISAPAAQALTATRIYWANDPTSIGEANLDFTGVNESFIPGTFGPFGVAVDGQRIYWANANANAIGVANLDATGVDQRFISGASGPFGVAVDRSHLFWANSISGTIGEANLDGTGVNQSFITGANDPLGVAVDGSHIYWANLFSNTIGEANLDGTGVNQNFITGANSPVGVAVDGSHIYWANHGSSAIGEANLDGTGVNQNFITPGPFNHFDPAGVVADGSHIYWTNNAWNAFGVANVDGTGVTEYGVAGASGLIGVAVSVPVGQVTPASPPAFATTPQGTLSNAQALIVSNTGQRDLSLRGLSFSGADAGDFIVTSDSCLGPVAPGDNCQITVSFAPQAQGHRSATLQIASNDYANSPLQVPLSGTGGTLPGGPQGPPGATGPQGPAGAAGQVELITCKTVTKTIKGHRRKVQRCAGRLVSGTIKFTASTATDRATISHGRVIYAIGERVRLGDGQTQLLVSQTRPIRPGQYTLTVRTRHRNRLDIRQRTIQID